MERTHGNLGTSLLTDPEADVLGFESLWPSQDALVRDWDVAAEGLREAPSGLMQRSAGAL